MNYIKINLDYTVMVGGQVATDEMKQDGWVEYEGEIPKGTDFKMVDDVLESYVPIKSDMQVYHESLDYLNQTDHKFYGDYDVKDNEDLTFIKEQRSQARSVVRSHLKKYKSPTESPTIV